MDLASFREPCPVYNHGLAAPAGEPSCAFPRGRVLIYEPRSSTASSLKLFPKVSSGLLCSLDQQDDLEFRGVSALPDLFGSLRSVCSDLPLDLAPTREPTHVFCHGLAATIPRPDHMQVLISTPRHEHAGDGIGRFPTNPTPHAPTWAQGAVSRVQGQDSGCRLWQLKMPHDLLLADYTSAAPSDHLQPVPIMTFEVGTAPNAQCAGGGSSKCKSSCPKFL